MINYVDVIIFPWTKLDGADQVDVQMTIASRSGWGNGSMDQWINGSMDQLMRVCRCFPKKGTRKL